MEREARICGSYKLIRILGSGNYANVWLAEHIPTKHLCAVKEIKKTELNEKERENSFIKESSMMKKLHHPFIVQHYESFSDNQNYYISMEYLPNGTLESLLKRSKQLCEQNIKKFAIELLIVLNYLHNEKHITHRDLKPENIMLDQNYNIVLTDFGFSSEYMTGGPELNTLCGSPIFCAPEILSSKSYSNKVDVWSLGVILYKLAVGHYPFEDDNINSLKLKICNTQPAFPSYISPAFSDLLKMILIKQPEYRPSITDIMKHQWFYTSNQFISHPPLIEYTIEKSILKQLTQYGINPDDAAKHILIGETENDVIIYWMLFSDFKTEQINQWAISLIHSMDHSQSHDVNLKATGRRQFKFKGCNKQYRRSIESIEQFSTITPKQSPVALDCGQRILKIPQVPVIVTRRMSRPNAIRKINDDY